jgi:hypothetical protein
MRYFSVGYTPAGYGVETQPTAYAIFLVGKELQHP